MSHIDDVTLALLAVGETTAGTPDARAHLAGCERCRREVASLGAVTAVARRVEPADRPVAPSPHVWDRIVQDIQSREPSSDADSAGSPALPAQPEPTVRDTLGAEIDSPGVARRRPRLLPLAAAAAVGVILGCGGTFALTHSTPSAPVGPVSTPTQVAVASLAPYDDPTAEGTAVVRAGSDAQRTLTVTVTGLPVKPGTFYEVWLMDPSNAHLVALGVLDAQGEGIFSVPVGLDLDTYSAVDVSLQPMNGSALHSGDSPVRGEIST